MSARTPIEDLVTARTTDVKTADTATPVHPLLAQRWSPRGFDPDHVLDDDAVTTLLPGRCTTPARPSPH